MNTAITILSFVLSLFKTASIFFDKFNFFKRERKNRKRFKEIEKGVKRGDVEKINDIFKN